MFEVGRLSICLRLDDCLYISGWTFVYMFEVGRLSICLRLDDCLYISGWTIVYLFEVDDCLYV